MACSIFDAPRSELTFVSSSLHPGFQGPLLVAANVHEPRSVIIAHNMGDRDFGIVLFDGGTRIFCTAVLVLLLHLFSSHLDLSLPFVLMHAVCNVCDATVSFIIPRDPKKRFKFASLQVSFHCVALTHSPTQSSFAREELNRLGKGHLVEVRLCVG